MTTETPTAGETIEQAPRGPGFTFTERMDGYLAEGATDYRKGARRGKRDGQSLWFRLTVSIPDLGSFRGDPQHRAKLTGVVGGALAGDAETPISDGEIQLFAPADGERLAMRYSFTFEADGQRRRFEGYKDVYNDRIIDVWPDTTTLFSTLRNEDGSGPEAKGILVIKPWRLVPQALSFRALSPGGPLTHVRATAVFLWFFSSTVVKEYRPRRRRSG